MKQFQSIEHERITAQLNNSSGPFCAQHPTLAKIIYLMGVGIMNSLELYMTRQMGPKSPFHSVWNLRFI